MEKQKWARVIFKKYTYKYYFRQKSKRLDLSLKNL